MHFTNRINRIQVSPTAVVISAAEQLKAKGVDIADFGPGEPDFPTPDHIKKAARSTRRLAESCRCGKRLRRGTTGNSVPTIREKNVW